MSEKTSMSNGATDKVTTLTPTTTPSAVSTVEDPERDLYRPKASTERVHQAIAQGLHDVAHEAAHQACQFMHLARYNDKDKPATVRYGHLADAAECLELAMIHLGRLQDAVFHRMQIDERTSLDDRC